MLALAAALAGCATTDGADETSSTTVGGGAAAASTGDPDVAASADATPVPDGVPLGYTHVRPDGNRVAPGTGALPSEPVDVPVDDTPLWVAGVPDGAETVWAAVLASGDVVGVRFGADTGPERVDVAVPGERGASTHTGPPLLAGGDDPALVTATGASPISHPVPAPVGLAFVREDGSVAIGGTVPETLDRGALPDARLVAAGDRLALYGDRTDAYVHGALGDRYEAGSLLVVDAATGSVTRRHAPPGDTVFEGVAPLWADLDGDGDPELLATASDSDAGARLLAYGRDRVLTGPAVGRGFRWRHQLAVAPFGPGGETEVAAVKTPHVGGTAEFYRVREDRLELAAERAGYSSHAIGSRNLDGAVAGDLDGDGRVELLVPDDARRELAALRRTGDGVAEAWRLPVGGDLTSNLSATRDDRGRLTVCSGRADALRFFR